jgi:hypothetical protein
VRLQFFGRWLSIIAVPLSVHAWADVGGANEGVGSSTDQARNLGYEGIDAYEAGRFEEAETKLSAAYRLLTVPSLGLWSARALMRLGKRAEAEQRYREVLALRLDTGDIAVQQAAQRDAERELNASSERQAIAVDVPPPVDSSPASWRPYAYPAWALGLLGFGGFAMAGALARSDERALSDDCPSATEEATLVGPGVCWKSDADERRDNYRRAFLLGDVGLVAGVVGAAAGTIVFLASGDGGSARTERWAAGLSLGAIGVVGLMSFVGVGLNARNRENQLERCTPNCSQGLLDAVDTRYAAASISAGVGLLALGGATWVLLAGSDDVESPDTSVSFGATPAGGTLSLSQRF